MSISDSCIFVYPSGDTSLSRMALEAKYLGYKRLVCANANFEKKHREEDGVEIISGSILKPKDFKDFSLQLRKTKSQLVMVYAGEAALNRSVLASGKVHILKGIENAPKKAFDDVCAVNAADKNVAVDIDISFITKKRGIIRHKALSAYADILKFHRAFGFPLTISSGAHSYLDLKSPREIINLCALFGMTSDEVLTALSAVDGLLKPYSPVLILENTDDSNTEDNRDNEEENSI